MLRDTLVFLLETAADLFVFALLLRFYLQLLRIPHSNPLSPFLFAITDFMVRPARKVIPGLWGIDLATISLAWVIELLLTLATSWLMTSALPISGPITIIALMLLAAVKLVRLSLNILLFSIVIQALLSWVNPYSPISGLLQRVTGPFLGIFSRRIPPIGNVDLSPLFALIAIQVLLMLPVAWVESTLLRLL